MSGLDNLFTTYGNDYGALGAMQAGQRRGLADMSTQLGNEQKAAETARYSAQTADSNRLMAGQARASELGNMQGEADAAQGVYGAKAGQSLQEAQLKAKQAQAAFEQLPVETQAKYHKAVTEKNMAMLTNLEQVLLQTGDLEKGIALIESDYPGATQDAGWEEAKQQYRGKSLDFVLNKIRTNKASFASSQTYGDPKFQGEMIRDDQNNQSRERIAKTGADASVQSAGIRGSSETKPTTEQFVYQQLRALYPNASEQELAQHYINYKTLVTKEQISGIAPELDTAVTTRKGGGSPLPGTGSKVIKLD